MKELWDVASLVLQGIGAAVVLGAIGDALKIWHMAFILGSYMISCHQ